MSGDPHTGHPTVWISSIAIFHRTWQLKWLILEQENSITVRYMCQRERERERERER